MRRIAVSLALAGVLALGACQGMDADTGGRTVGGAAAGAAGGAVIGALTGNWGKGAAIGALAGGAGGLLYDQHQKGGL
jgi:osmotically inducible lipoprotein OsmB